MLRRAGGDPIYESVFAHRYMLSDHVRMTAYRSAIREVVRKGDVVADIGTGSGALAFLSLQAGARKVYAVEETGVIEDARKLATINGLEDRIEFISGRSDTVELPEMVDVVTSEILGSFGLDENVLRFMADAHKRFLKPGGVLVPRWLDLYLVPVDWAAFWQDHVGVWSNDYYGLDLSPVKRLAVSQTYVERCSGRAKPLAPACMIAHMAFHDLDAPPSRFEGKAVIAEGGVLHGLVGFFRAGLSAKITLSTSPEDPDTHWRQTFFPMGDAIPVQNGDEVCFKLIAIPQVGASSMSWQWETSVYREGRTMSEFSQCDLVISKEEIALGRDDFRPSISHKAEVARRVLDLCDGNRSMGEIAELVRADFPQEYLNHKESLRGVAGVLRSLVKLA